MGIELYLVAGKRDTGKGKARLRRRGHPLVTRRGDHEHDQAGEGEVALGAAQQGDMPQVGRIEAPPEQPDQGRYSSGSSPTKTSSPSLAPAARRAAASASSLGGRPTTR